MKNRTVSSRIVAAPCRAALVLVSALLAVPTAASAATLERGPYLQRGAPDEVTVRWRTLEVTDATVSYGTDPASLDLQASGVGTGTEHEIRLTGLQPDTRYHYRIGDASGTLSEGAGHYFDTHPPSGSETPTRIWVLGDSGTANSEAASVRDAYESYNRGRHADVWLMLGDNAYNSGTDAEYQAAVFDFYPETLRNSILWSTLGNHDGYTALSSNQSGPYYDIFTFPKNGESGGIGSGTEAYYSFDYANIHFVSLNSYDVGRSASGTMANWLRDDLGATDQEWIIAFWHHPPYSKGSHDSDRETELREMRENFLPILESFGVDLVLGGHSHSYERSRLIDGHYGRSDTFDPAFEVDGGDGDPQGDGAYAKWGASNNGAVYTVAGSSGKKTSAPLNHPVMVTKLLELGSMVIDVDGRELDARFLNDTGAVRDHFRIVHASPPTDPPNPPSGLAATALSDSEIRLTWTDGADDESGFEVQRSTDGTAWQSVATPGANATVHDDTGLAAETSYLYRVLAVNAAGDSSPSNEAGATTLAAPDYVDHFVTAERSLDGNVSGSEAALDAKDGSTQSVRESVSGGKPSRRLSALEHEWRFDGLPVGRSAVILADAWSSGSIDDDAFAFSYSSDGGVSWQELFVVDDTRQDVERTGLVASTGDGTVLVRARDTDRTPGNAIADTLTLDRLVARVMNGTGTAPAAPTALSATGVSATTVTLGWQDNASDEAGFDLERSTDGVTWQTVGASLAADATSTSDTGLSPETTYTYRLSAFNAYGRSGYAQETVTTDAVAVGDIELTLAARKRRARLEVDLSWSGTDGAAIDIHRQDFNDPIATLPDGNGNRYTDVTGLRGSGTMSYRVCLAGTDTCSANETVVY